ncbi:MAG: hypothetical protein GY737_00230 [Desulfobacteraceae bacterium]|nr:hypothetical protein [Desulfobacteraceae bacterium]
MSKPVWVTPILHPTTISRGMWKKEPANERYIERVVNALQGKVEIPRWDISTSPPNTILYPTLEDLTKWKADYDSAGFDAISHDLETAGEYIICDGITGLNLETGERGVSLVLRFRTRGGSQYWTVGDLPFVVGWWASLFDDPLISSLFQNGATFDCPIIVKHGLPIKGPILDTMIMASRAYSEEPKGLQYLATKWCWAPVWKTLTDLEEEEGKE